MRSPACFHIDELVLKYSLHPELRDVYVEGNIDKGVLGRFLDEMNIDEDTVIYSIDTVDVPAEVVRKHNQRVGERGEVVALAMELQEQLPDGHEHLTLVADADYGYILDNLHECSLLLYTDGTTLDMYAFNEHTVGKFLQMSLGSFRYSASHVLGVLTPVLVDRFLVRATNESLGWAMTWQASLKCVTVGAEGSAGFDVQKFVRNYLNRNHRQADRDEFLGELERLRSGMGSDIRKYIRGEDFPALLSHFIRHWIRRNIRNPFSNAAAVAVVLRGCLEAKELQAETLFQALVSRMA